MKSKQSQSTEPARKTKRKLVGVVRKKSGDKTVAVTVERFIKHPIYKKFYRQSKNYLAHDADNNVLVGDRVEITESRPLSAKKRFRVTNIIKSDSDQN